MHLPSYYQLLVRIFTVSALFTKDRPMKKSSHPGSLVSTSLVYSRSPTRIVDTAPSVHDAAMILADWSSTMAGAYDRSHPTEALVGDYMAEHYSISTMTILCRVSLFQGVNTVFHGGSIPARSQATRAAVAFSRPSHHCGIRSVPACRCPISCLFGSRPSPSASEVLDHIQGLEGEELVMERCR
jgi:hypothetical protein